MYDLLIIGAGSAGSVVANRASEDPNRTVLLLEAGPDYDPIAQTPFDLVNSHNNSYQDHDWSLRYSPTHGRDVPFPRGRVTGGSSSVNTTIALRGMPEDYNEWASLGNTEWCWERVLPAFKRLERDLDYGDEDYHGDAGPIPIRRYPDDELLPQHQAFLETAYRLDYPNCPDANDPLTFGAGPQPMNKLGRLRISCAMAYLAPARLRPNLTIRPNTTVLRLILEQKKCVGVEVEVKEGLGESRTEIIRAKTIVLSAGAIMSPAILMRSGVGPRLQLEKHGIKVEIDVPGVGQNLSDHPAISIVADTNQEIDIDSPLIQTILRYTAEGSEKRNDLQIELLSFIPGKQPQIGIAAVLEYQYGRGEVTLQSANPHILPKIENRFCEDERDLSRLVRCYKDALAFTRQKPLSDMITQVRFPDPMRANTDDDLANLCRKFSGSGFHPCGTLKMGDDPLAVVDQFGRARQVDNLVIADASIMPFVPSANINLTCIMIGERIGEWIRTRPGTYGL